MGGVKDNYHLLFKYSNFLGKASGETFKKGGIVVSVQTDIE